MNEASTSALSGLGLNAVTIPSWASWVILGKVSSQIFGGQILDKIHEIKQCVLGVSVPNN